MADRQPVQLYRPSVRLRLHVRFDEFGAHDLPKPPSKKPATLRKGTDDAALEVQEQDGRLVLAAKGSTTSSDASLASPTSQSSSSDGRTWPIDGVIPSQLTLTHNGIRTASQLTCDIRFADLPFDPRLVRACAVEAYVGCVSAEDYRDGVAGMRRSSGPNRGMPMHVVPDGFTDAAGQQRSNLRFQGWVDEWSVEFGADDAPKVHLECTDSTRLLIDTDAPPKLTVNPKSPIDRGIADYLAAFPQFVGLSVAFLPAGATPPTPADAISKLAHSGDFGPPPSTGKTTVWDYLTDCCGMLGLVVRFVGTTVVVQRPRTLYGARFSGRPDDPFQRQGGRSIDDGRSLTSRLYVYGRNIDTLSFKRKLSRWNAKNVEVRCYVPRLGKTLVSRYPISKDDRQDAPTAGDQTDQKWKVHYVQGVEDQKTLDAYAQGIYESVGRQELGTDFSTHSLASFGGDDTDPDMLDALPGDTVTVEINRSPYGTTVQQAAAESAADGRRFLERLGYPSDLADAYDRAANNVGFPTSFRLQKLAVEWQDEEGGGLALHAELCNYVEVRSDKELPDDETQPSDGSSSSGSSTVGA